jgi:alpha-L-rhamnosidase
VATAEHETALLPKEARMPLTIRDLRCEYLLNPLGIDVPAPRLSYKIESDEPDVRQTAYQMRVATTPERLAAGDADLWDSGWSSTDQSSQIVYAGRALETGMRCDWSVRVRDQDGRISPWSDTAFWTMGRLTPADWQAVWIGAPAGESDDPAPLLRTAFDIGPLPVRATVSVSGLGFYEMRLNGAKVGDHELDPAFTRYDRRVLYATYDILAQLRPGENVIGAVLGNGWYDYGIKAAWDFDAAPWRDRPKLLMEATFEFADGTTRTIATGPDWRTMPGPILSNGLLTGETYDARREIPGWDAPGFDARKWTESVAATPPEGALSAQMLPPIRVTETRTAVSRTEPRPGVWVYDIGQTVAGVGEIILDGPAGAVVEIQYGEALNPDGTLNQDKISKHTHQPGFQTDRFVLDGGGPRAFRARFTYHGFQYVQITSVAAPPASDEVRALVMHTDFAPVGSFACSDTLLNQIQRNTLWSFRGNFHGIPTDCPQREKNGWTGDAHLAAETGLYNFDMAASYAKWLQDIQDEQRDDGALPGIVPTAGWGYAWGNGPAWDSAYLLIAWRLYEFCGDIRVLERHYENFKRYLDYVASRSDGRIPAFGLGDWCPAKTETPAALTSTAYYYRDAQIVADAARLLGRPDEVARYDALAAEIRSAFNAAFFDSATGRYGEGSQTAQACALYFDLAPPEHRDAVLANLVAAVKAADHHIDCGILGTKYLLHVLTDHGRADLALRVATQTTFPSWGHWIALGATTHYEQWDENVEGDLSRNHIMFGDISAWFYRCLAGIRPDAAKPGFASVVIKPLFVAGLDWVRARHESIRGTVESAWRREGDLVILTIEIPANVGALVFVPGGEVVAPHGARRLADEDGAAVFAVGAGRWSFTARAATP